MSFAISDQFLSGGDHLCDEHETYVLSIALQFNIMNPLINGNLAEKEKHNLQNIIKNIKNRIQYFWRALFLGLRQNRLSHFLIVT